MDQIFNIIIAFASSALTAIIIMPWLLSLCHKHELTTEASDTKKFRIPRIGGMILAPATAIGLSVSMALRLYQENISDTLKSSALLIALGVMLIYLVGLIDDIFGLNRWQKRLMLIVSSIAFPICSLYVNDLYGLFGVHHLSYSSGIILTMTVTILAVKGFESMNDTDGLIGAVSIIPLVYFSIIYFQLGYFSYATIAASMLGALTIYLYYNLFGDQRIGTKTYMGHAGALILSYSVIYLSLKYAMNNVQVINSHSDGLAIAFAMIAIPMFEYVRVWATSSWMGLDKEHRRNLHIQHLLEKKGFTHRQIMAIVLCAGLIILTANSLLHRYLQLNMTWIFLTDIALYSIWIFIMGQQMPRTQHEEPMPHEFPDYIGEEGLVSVIMPTWNSAQFVAESIESIQAQTYKHWELIITDDCSTDNTMAIVEHYARHDNRIRVQCNERNGGAGVSRNHSIESARGQYIAFCDSDDRWTPDKLELQIKFMRDNDVALSFAPYYSCNEKSQYLGYISAPRRVNLFQMMCDNKMGFLTCIYDTRTLGKHQMPRQRKRQDHALLLNLLKICHYAYSVPVPLAHYRIHSGNISGKKISLLKYNAQTYTEVFGWPKPVSYAFLFVFFLPTYFCKRGKNLFLTILRAI